MVEMEKIVSLAKRRGFVYPSSDIYGGFANAWDYGPYGTQLKKNIQDHWWRKFVLERENIIGLDSSIIVNPRVWEASGHIKSFSDPLIDCKKCRERIRGDKLIEEKTGENIFAYADALIAQKIPVISEELAKNKSNPLNLVNIIIAHDPEFVCPHCGSNEFTAARQFNLMFKTHQGVVEESSAVVYMRPETAQGIFINFKNILDSTRIKIPFGIAQIGKSFRNEITPGNFTYRTREFEQMEIEYFIEPENQDSIKQIFQEWQQNCQDWFKDIGINESKLRYREHEKDELSHYSSMTFDIEYLFPFGWGELMGIAYRGCYDLDQHQKMSGKDLSYQDPQTNKKYLPHVIEPAFGLSRTTLVALIDAYNEDEIDGEKRIVMKFAPQIAPVKAAIFPLLKKDELMKKSRQIFDDLKSLHNLEFDESGSIGKRYRRQDEIGTPFCITVDFDTLEDETVTIRDRDSLKQERIQISKIKDFLEQKLR